MKKREVDTRVCHISISSKDVDMFQRLYPNCLNRFVRNVVHDALNDKNLFDKHYFKDIQ